MESGKSADESGNSKDLNADETQKGGSSSDNSTSSDKVNNETEKDNTNESEVQNEKSSSESGTTAGIKRTHSTEEDTGSSSTADDIKRRRRKEDRVKSGSNSGGSPKSVPGAESEGEDKSVESPGPKVPPLKIVISGASLEETGSGGRNGKNGSGRHHLPYIVSAPPETETAPQTMQMLASNDESKEDRGAASGEESCGLSGAATSGTGAGHGTGLAGTRSHQRVLRSHRGKKGSESSRNNKDKDSNSNSGSATSSPAGMGEVPSPRQVSPTPNAGSEITSEGEDKISVGTASSNVISVRNDRENSSNRENEMEKTSTPPPPPPQELHPRKRKIKPRDQQPPPPANGNGSHATVPVSANGSTALPAMANQSLGICAPGEESGPEASLGSSVSGNLETISNSYQLFLNIRKQIERKRKGLFPVQPKPPQGFKDYLMNRCTYVLANNNSNRIPPPTNKPPPDLNAGIKELFLQQEKERHRLLMQHVIEKEKLVLSVEQEILRVHGRAARALANQALPFSACTILRDEEVYSAITPEQEEKDRNARSRYNGRLFLSWLQDVDDKWEKIKEAMLLRHHNEAESLHAVQKMDWEWKMKELGICEMKSTPVIDDTHVPVVHVSDDFDLLPA